MPDAWRRSGGERRRSSPRVLFAGNRTQGGVAVMGAAVTRISRHGASRKAQLAQGGESPRRGKLRDVKRPACREYADRRISKLRPGCVSAVPQGMRSRPERQTHSDRHVEDEAQGFINGVQRGERSTPTRRLVDRRPEESAPAAGRVQGEKGQSLQPSGLGRRRGTCVKPRRFDLRCVRRAKSSPHGQHSLLGDPPESESSVGPDPGKTGIVPPGF